MFTFISFVLTILGCINWLMIGLLQYDFVAGMFGWQSSLMSRLVYIAFGIGAIYLVLRVLLSKGSVKVWEKKKKKAEVAPAAVQSAENGEEIVKIEKVIKQKPKKFWQFWKKEPKKTQNAPKIISETPSESEDEPFSMPQSKVQDNLFDEHLNK